MKMMKKSSVVAGIAAVGMVAAFNASAALTITTSTTAAFHITSAAHQDAAQIAADLGITTTQLGSLLFAFGGDGPGTIQSSYTDSPSNINSAPPLTISYVSGQTVADATYLYVKDGNAGAYIYNLGSTGTDPLDWNGTEQIVIDDLFGKGAGDFSDVDFFGSSGGVLVGGSVPEPSTIFAAALLLLPLGTSALRIYRNRVRTQ